MAFHAAIFCEGDDLPRTRRSVPTAATSLLRHVFDPNNTLEQALEAEGKVDEAWALLYEEWRERR